MIDELKPYPEYRESGLSWLGKVPEHWEMRQARQIGRLLKGVGGTKEDAVPDGVPCVRYGELYTTYNYFIRANKTFVKVDRALDYTRIHFGDVLFAASGETIDEIGKSAVNLMISPACCGGDVIILRPSIPVHSPFLGYATDCWPARVQKATMGRGTTIKHIYPSELRRLLVPLPTLEEQAAIVRFLDHANGKIERAIRAKRKLIALLNEQKQAIIHRAVTRGLDANVKLKPSGVSWLGDLPEHWSIKRLKWVTRLQRGYDLPDQNRVAGAYPVVSSGGIIDSHYDYRAKAPGVVMGRYGSTDSVFFIEQDYWPHNTSLFVTDFQGNDPRWCYYLLRTISKADHAGKSAVPGVDRKDLFEIRVAEPPVVEQQAMVRHIDHECELFNRAIDGAEREIALLREYRTTLTADVVTGKLDVREALKHLPAQADEPLPPDDSEYEGLADNTIPSEPEA